jgi:hypothetical protein
MPVLPLPLLLLQSIAQATGVLLDPVYSGKGALKMVEEIQQDPEAWKGRNILFMHTGGLLVRGLCLALCLLVSCSLTTVPCMGRAACPLQQHTAREVRVPVLFEADCLVTANCSAIPRYHCGRPADNETRVFSTVAPASTSAGCFRVSCRVK